MDSYWKIIKYLSREGDEEPKAGGDADYGEIEGGEPGADHVLDHQPWVLSVPYEIKFRRGQSHAGMTSPEERYTCE